MDTQPLETSYPLLGRRPIMKEGVRILRPQEYQMLLDAATELKPSNGIKLDTLLTTGLRYVEAQRVHDNPDWFDGKFIHLPPGSMRKDWGLQKERWVRLSPRGASALREFFELKNLPSHESWREDLLRWASKTQLNPIGLGPKTTRKTWESWLVFCHSPRANEIMMSQGHTSATSFRYYLNMPFLNEEEQFMKPWIDGFFSD